MLEVYTVSMFFLLQTILNAEPCTQVPGTLSVLLEDRFLEVILLEQKPCTIKMPRSIRKLLQHCIVAFILSQENLKAILHAVAFLIIANPMKEKWQPVGLICISLAISEIEQLSVCLLVICISSSENCI